MPETPAAEDQPTPSTSHEAMDTEPVLPEQLQRRLAHVEVTQTGLLVRIEAAPAVTEKESESSSSPTGATD